MWWPGTGCTSGCGQVAAQLCEEAIALLSAVDDRVGLYDALCQAAAIDLYRGRLDACRAELDRAEALDLKPESVPPRFISRLLAVRAYYDNEAGDHESALQCSRDLVAASADLGPGLQAQAWVSRGRAFRMVGRYDECVEALSNAARLYAEAGDRTGESLAVNQIDTAQREAGRPELALERHRGALSIAHDVGDANALLDAHMELGTSLLATGELDEPLHHLWRARTVAESLGQRSDVGRTLDRLGQTYQARGELDLARQHWRRALEIMTEIGLPEADRVRRDLAALDDRPT